MFRDYATTLKIKKNVSEEIHGLSKIPDCALVKILQTEVGQLKSYIEELEETVKDKIKEGNKKLEERVSELSKQLKEERKEIKAQFVYDELLNSLRTENKSLKERNKRLEKDKEDLFSQLVKARKQ